MSYFWGLFFSCFHRQKINFNFFFHYSVRTEKLLDTNIEKKQINRGSIFGGLKIGGFLGLAVLVIIARGVCPLLLRLVSLNLTWKVVLQLGFCATQTKMHCNRIWHVIRGKKYETLCSRNTPFICIFSICITYDIFSDNYLPT